MKSDCLPAMPLLDENNPFKFSLGAIFLRLLRSSCSAKTLAVRAAVPSFFMASEEDSGPTSLADRLGPIISPA